MTFRLRPVCYLAPVLALLAAAPRYAAAQGYSSYPYSIMAPERGSVTRHRAATPSSPAKTSRGPAAPIMPRYPRRHALAARGSSGLVLPTPLPRTELIPPEGGVAAARPLPQEQPPTVLPGLNRPIPNLPHGPETFQDRASRCAFQQGLYNVPANLSTRGIWARACSDWAHNHAALPVLSRQSMPRNGSHGVVAGRVAWMRGSNPRMIARQETVVHRKLALILSSAAEPGHSSFSPSALSGVSTVLRWPCRSSASGVT